MQARIYRYRPRLDTIAVFACAILAGVSAIMLDAFESLHELIRQYDAREFGKIITVLFFLGMASLVLTVRRAGETPVREAAEPHWAAEPPCSTRSRDPEQLLKAALEDMSQLLNGLLATASLLVETDLTEEQRRHVRAIGACGDTLLERTGDVVELSNLEAGRVEIEGSEFDLVEATETVLGMVEARARMKDVLVVFSPSPELPSRVTGDAGRLRQILLKLTRTAVELTTSGSVVLRAAPKDTQQGRFVRFEVRHSGSGIADESREALFQQFDGIEAAGKPLCSDAGLRLAICKRLVTAMGGRIGFESRSGEGGVFWFELPLRAAENAAPRHRELPSAGRRVLLAAPCGPGWDAASDLLASHGFEVVAPGSAGSKDVDIALLHHSALPSAPFRRRTGTTNAPKPWIAFGFGASRHSGSVDAVIDGALKPSDLVKALAQVGARLGTARPRARPRPKVAARKTRIPAGRRSSRQSARRRHS